MSSKILFKTLLSHNSSYCTTDCRRRWNFIFFKGIYRGNKVMPLFFIKKKNIPEIRLNATTNKKGFAYIKSQW